MYHTFISLILTGLMATSLGCQRAKTPATNATPIAFYNDNGNSQRFKPLMAAPIPNEKILKREGYYVSYNTQTRQPNYVAWLLTPERLKGHAKRSATFFEDPELTMAEKSTIDDYRSSRLDRGHMCPAGDNKWSQTAMIETFYLSNVCPQSHTLNSGDWNDLEIACRDWVKERHERIYIVSGPLFGENPRKLKKHVWVPSRFFKLLLCLDKGKEKGIAFVYDNAPTHQPMSECVCSIDDIERITGFDFFAPLSKSIQKQLEAQHSLHEWK